MADKTGRQVGDQRKPPFCYQTHAALDRIREHFAGAKLTSALGIYLVLTEAANRTGGASARGGFEQQRTDLAAAAGVSVDTLDRYVAEFVKAGVLAVEKRKAGKVNLPNLWGLTEPDTAAAGAPPGRTGAATPGRTGAAPRARDSLPLEERELEKGSPNGDPTLAVHPEPPKLVKLGGRDVAFDALARVCRAGDRNAQKEVGRALNGTKGIVGIRQLAWDELTDDARALYLDWSLRETGAYEQYLAEAIPKRATAYVEAMNGAMLTPLALAKWWGRVEGLPRKGGLSAAEIARLG